jgi:hypothetical protein
MVIRREERNIKQVFRELRDCLQKAYDCNTLVKFNPWGHHDRVFGPLVTPTDFFEHASYDTFDGR